MNVAVRPLSVLSLCTGIGGLELALQLALPGATRLVAAVERDPHAAAVLVARMEDQTLDQAPIWDDLATFDGAAWRGRVDLLCAGFPCQPWSAAGQGRGLDDDRWIWPHIARIVGDVGPRVVFLENVPGLTLRGGLGAVLGDLAELGFDAEWSSLSAASVGASHRRDRLWILAYRNGSRLPLVGREPGHDRHTWNHLDRPSGPPVANAPHDGPIRGGHARTEGSDDQGHRTGPAVDRPSLADAAGTGPQGRVHRLPRRRQGPLRGSEDLPLFPPGPDDHDRWRWLLDICPSVEPSVLRDADGTAHRLDRLHAVGNGVVPLVAATAFLGLARRAGLLDEGGGLT